MIGFDWFLVPRFAHRRACRRRHGRVGVVVGGSWASPRPWTWPGWSVKTVGWGHGGGLEIPQMEAIWCHPIGGETLVTDG